MARFVSSLLVTVSLLLLLSATSASRLLLSANSSPYTYLPDNASCKLASNYSWSPPFCKGGPLFCVMKSSLPSADGYLHGTCNSNYLKKSYCTIGAFNFAVGVKSIPPYGPTACETCTCVAHPEIRGRKNKGVCECDPLPPCYIDTVSGKEVGSNCMYEIQTSCVIVKVNGGKVIDGKSTHLGQCQAPQTSVCVSAGPDWGPFFYALGTKGVPLPGDRCRSCSCRNGGFIGKCQKITGCTEP